MNQLRMCLVGLTQQIAYAYTYMSTLLIQHIILYDRKKKTYHTLFSINSQAVWQNRNFKG